MASSDWDTPEQLGDLRRGLIFLGVGVGFIALTIIVMIITLRWKRFRSLFRRDSYQRPQPRQTRAHWYSNNPPAPDSAVDVLLDTVGTPASAVVHNDHPRPIHPHAAVSQDGLQESKHSIQHRGRIHGPERRPRYAGDSLTDILVERESQLEPSTQFYRVAHKP